MILRTTTIALLLLATSLVFFASTLSERPFHTKGEGREAIVVTAMFDQHNMILPLRNGADIPSKPPMFHWIAVASSTLFHEVSEFSIRFPSALCAALTLCCVFVFATQLSTIKTGLITCLILVTAFEFSRSANHARVDMTFTFWLNIAFISLYQNITSWHESRKSSFLWTLTTIIAVAGAVLSKGPAGLLLPWIVAAIYLLTLNRSSLTHLLNRQLFTQILLTLLGSVLIAGTWYLLAYFTLGREFLDVQLLKENVARVVTIEGANRGHEKPFYFGLINLSLGFLPWTILFPIGSAWYWKNRKKLLDPSNTGLLYCSICSLVFLSVATISLSKRVVYLLPAYPALSYMLAYTISDITSKGIDFNIPRKITATILSFISFSFLCTLSIIIFLALFGDANSLSKFTLSPSSLLYVSSVLNIFSQDKEIILLYTLVTFLLVSSAFFCWKGNNELTAGSICSSMLLLMISVNGYFMPSFAALSSPKEFMTEVKSAIPAKHALYKNGGDFYSATYYHSSDIPDISLTEIANSKKDLYVLFRENNLDALVSQFPASEDTFKILLTSDTNAADGKDQLALVRFSKEMRGDGENKQQ